MQSAAHAAPERSRWAGDASRSRTPPARTTAVQAASSRNARRRGELASRMRKGPGAASVPATWSRIRAAENAFPSFPARSWTARRRTAPAWRIPRAAVQDVSPASRKTGASVNAGRCEPARSSGAGRERSAPRPPTRRMPIAIRSARRARSGPAFSARPVRPATVRVSRASGLLPAPRGRVSARRCLDTSIPARATWGLSPATRTAMAGCARARGQPWSPTIRRSAPTRAARC